MGRNMLYWNHSNDVSVPSISKRKGISMTTPNDTIEKLYDEIMRAPRQFLTPKTMKELPEVPGVSVLFDKKNKLIYVGETGNLKRRLRNLKYRNGAYSPRNRIAKRYLKYTLPDGKEKFSTDKEKILTRYIERNIRVAWVRIVVERKEDDKKRIKVNDKQKELDKRRELEMRRGLKKWIIKKDKPK